MVKLRRIAPPAFQLGVLFLLLVTTPAKTQLGVGVAPPYREFTLSLGDKTRSQATFFSRHNYRGNFTLEVLDWTIDPESGSVLPRAPGHTPYSASEWVKLATSQAPLSFNKDTSSLIARYEISVPHQPGLEGSYWTAIALTTLPSPPREESKLSVRVSLRVMHIIYVTIAGTEKPGAKIQTFAVKKSSDSKELILDIVNTGNVYLRLKPKLHYKSKTGATLETTDLSERVLLRDGLIRYRIPLNQAPEDAVIASIEVRAKSLPYVLYAETGLK